MIRRNSHQFPKSQKKISMIRLNSHGLAKSHRLVLRALLAIGVTAINVAPSRSGFWHLDDNGQPEHRPHESYGHAAFEWAGTRGRGRRRFLPHQLRAVPTLFGQMERDRQHEYRPRAPHRHTSEQW